MELMLLDIFQLKQSIFQPKTSTVDSWMCPASRGIRLNFCSIASYVVDWLEVRQLALFILLILLVLDWQSI